MQNNNSPEKATELREALADVSHDIWSHWMRYLLTKCNTMRPWLSEGNEEAFMVFPMSLAERWTRQINTPYAELSESEKDSDREQADKILGVLDTPSEGLRELVSASLRMLDAESAYNSFEGESGIAEECEAARTEFKALVARLASEEQADQP